MLQSVIKIIGKTAFWATFYFYPLPSLNNVEKQWAKLVSSYVMDLQHCIGMEGGFLNKLFQISIFFTDCLKFIKK